MGTSVPLNALGGAVHPVLKITIHDRGLHPEAVLSAFYKINKMLLFRMGASAPL